MVATNAILRYCMYHSINVHDKNQIFSLGSISSSIIFQQHSFLYI